MAVAVHAGWEFAVAAAFVAAVAAIAVADSDAGKLHCIV